MSLIFLTDGLKRLEYRGYDSSGIAVNAEAESSACAVSAACS